MAAKVLPSKLEKKPVSFSNLLCTCSPRFSLQRLFCPRHVADTAPQWELD